MKLNKVKVVSTRYDAVYKDEPFDEWGCADDFNSYKEAEEWVNKNLPHEKNQIKIYKVVEIYFECTEEDKRN